MTKGIESLKGAVKSDCDKGEGCFNEGGCDKSGRIKCFHKYCDKFKWIMDRAAHYTEKLDIDKEELIGSWEENRSYWYMNYYQDANQPELKEGNVFVFDTVEALKESIGGNGFRCPSCGGVSSNPYKCDTGIEVGKGKICDWKSYGLLGCVGKGASVFVKEKLTGDTFFMPVAWEKTN